MKAWLLDAYAVSGGIRTWWIGEQGRRFSADRAFSPTFYVGKFSRAGDVKPWEQVRTWLARMAWEVKIELVERMELQSGERQEVLAVTVRDPLNYAPLVRGLTRAYPWLILFQADLPVVQYALNMWEWYPTMWCEFEVDQAGWIQAARRLDSRDDIDPQVPVLRFISLRLDGESSNPRHGKRGALVMSAWESRVPQIKGVVREFIVEADADLPETVQRFIGQHDPDIIMTEWGDDFLFPQLMEQAQRAGVTVAWNRDADRQVDIGQEHTYFSYGQVKHRAPIVTCFGRLHIDIKNSFLHTEGELDGLFELARLSSLPIQRLARTTIGTAMSAMQLLTAIRWQVLIPVDKRQSEDWKTAEQLVLSDKGGLVYQPILGFREEVLELDFSSLYPTIMVRFNVSPETINCTCCATDPAVRIVPEIGYRVCVRRRGLVSETLEIILVKRAECKRRMAASGDPVQRTAYDRRQNTLKWILVTCFGYLGFKNARFGRIEAHESVTAFGRELLLQAKNLAEEHGFRFLHGIVDSVWLHKPQITRAEAEQLSQEIFQLTKIEMKIEGMYHWIAFLPSKADQLMPVANRYFGLFTTGEYKVRGIELRRHDTPRLILRFQKELLQLFVACKTVAEIQQHFSEALNLLDEYLDQVAQGRIPFEDVTMTRRVSRDPKGYTNRTLTAIVAQELMGRGVEVSPGEMIQYVITDAHSSVPEMRARALVSIDADWSYDVEVYQDLLLKAVDSLFAQLGLDFITLKNRSTPPQQPLISPCSQLLLAL